MGYKTTLLISLIAVGLSTTPATAKKKNNLPDPVTDSDFTNHRPEKVELGRLLMFDKILSGNRNISCATCHHALTDTGDGLSLPVGEGGFGLGKSRNTGNIIERVPRNAPPVFNLGAHEFQVLFHDGRVTADPDSPSGCKSPAAEKLPEGLENVLACQAMFPVTSGAEMAGGADENDIGIAAAAGDLAGPDGVWAQLAERLRDPANNYIDLFIGAFDDIGSANDITYVHAANAIAAFEATNWRADNSPFDRYLRGEKKAMSKNAVQGMKLFYKGDSNGQACASCHSGKFQTDHSFHSIAMPQIGPGKGDNSDGYVDKHEDFGRGRETGNEEDRFKFRTPTLRNVALTAPYGHAGAYNTLRAVVEHHLNPVDAIHNYRQDQAVLPPDDELDADDFVVMNDSFRVGLIADSNDIQQPLAYTERDVDMIIEFLHALTDPSSIDLRDDQPFTVPSGIAVSD